MSLDVEPSGAVRVAKEVVSSIAAMAAEEVDGVAGTDPFGEPGLRPSWWRRPAHRGVRVEIDSSNRLHLDVFISVHAGREFRQVGERVQASVSEAVGKMLGLDVAEVNVHVSGVTF